MEALVALAPALARALGFLAAAFPSEPGVFPWPARACLAPVLALALPVAAGGEVGATTLLGELLLGGLAGFAVGLPFRVLLAACARGAEGLLPGSGGLPRAALLLGAATWACAGGLEVVLATWLDLARAFPPGSGVEFPGVAAVEGLGRVAFLAALAGFLPAAAMALVLELGMRMAAAPAGQHRGALPWARPARHLAAAMFLAFWLEPLSSRAGAAVLAGLRVMGGG